MTAAEMRSADAAAYLYAHPGEFLAIPSKLRPYVHALADGASVSARLSEDLAERIAAALERAWHDGAEGNTTNHRAVALALASRVESATESATESANAYPGEDDLVEVVTRALWPDLGDRLTAIRAVRVVLDEQVRRPNPPVAPVRDRTAGAPGQGGGELATFARWLIAMDDPDDADGMRARQTVTLTSIIAQARAALAVDRAPATDGDAS